MATISTERADEGPYATVVISNPDQRNALTESDASALARAIRELDEDDAVRCVVLTGEGDTFCAGANLVNVEGTPTAESIDRGYHAAVRELLTCRMPVLSKVRGAAIGAGASLATACDLVYADESARIGFSFSRIGLTADTGATFVLPRLVGPQRALELLLTADVLDAADAEDLGLVTRVCSADSLDDRVHERAVDLATGPTRALSSLRRLVLRSNANTLEEQLELEAREQVRMLHTQDVMEGVAAFAEDRDPAFEGH